MLLLSDIPSRHGDAHGVQRAEITAEDCTHMLAISQDTPRLDEASKGNQVQGRGKELQCLRIR
jgi:hypothetical protein